MTPIPGDLDIRSAALALGLALLSAGAGYAGADAVAGDALAGAVPAGSTGPGQPADAGTLPALPSGSAEDCGCDG